MADETVDSALKRHARGITSLPGVVGIAEGEADGRPCIRVFVERKRGQLLEAIPQGLDGWPVIVEETEGFSALEEGDRARDGKAG